MSIVKTQLVSELGAFYRLHQAEIASMFNGLDSELQPHLRTMTKVKGRVPQISSIIHNVIQGFTSTWSPMGKTHFLAKELLNYRLKVNYPIKPDDIEHSWLAYMNEEGKALKDRSISKYITEVELKPRIADDYNDLMVNGVYDAGDLGTFGKSMNGLATIITGLLANTTRPCYKIPLTAITDSNVVEQITAFERALPQAIKPKIKKIFLSQNNLERYLLDYEATYGASTLATIVEGVSNSGGMIKVRTRVGKRELIGISNLADNIVFATVEGNMVKIIDQFDAPAMTDAQISDYEVKLFFEFWLGIDFAVNEMVFAGNFTDADAGYPAALFTVNNGTDGKLPKLFRDQLTWV